MVFSASINFFPYLGFDSITPPSIIANEYIRDSSPGKCCFQESINVRFLHLQHVNPGDGTLCSCRPCKWQGMCWHQIFLPTTGSKSGTSRTKGQSPDHHAITHPSILVWVKQWTNLPPQTTGRRNTIDIVSTLQAAVLQPILAPDIFFCGKIISSADSRRASHKLNCMI